MVTIRPFAALRPRPDLAARICELPYDVMSSDEARQLASGNPLSFLHVSKPEIDLPPGTDPYSPAVYAQGQAHFLKLQREGALQLDPGASFYLYRQVMGSHSQTGLVALANCEEYLHGIVKKHELTRVDKEDDRVRHIEAVGAQTGPAFLTYRALAAMDALVAQRTQSAPDVDFTAPDGVRHSSWSIREPAQVQFIQEQFRSLPCLYIADGHHRSAAAGRIFKQRGGQGGSAGFLSVIFPHHQMQILPYHRVLKDLNGRTPSQLLQALAAVCEPAEGDGRRPAAPHLLGLYLEGRWHSLRFSTAVAGSPDPFEQLDVTILQRQVLAPLFGIDDPRTSKRIDFVGGIRGPAELERLVDSGAFACAFAMHPTRLEDLMAIADAGGIMPPKSTWFEPKLRDGMFSHLL